MRDASSITVANVRVRQAEYDKSLDVGFVMDTTCGISGYQCVREQDCVLITDARRPTPSCTR